MWNWVSEIQKQVEESDMTMGSGMNLITTVIGFGMSATFIIFVCTRIICGRLRGVESRPMFEIESRTDLEQVCKFFSDLGTSPSHQLLFIIACMFLLSWFQ